MYELGVLIFPNDILELAMVHNKSFFPPDCQAAGYSMDERYFYVQFSTDEDVGRRPIPLEAEDGEFHVKGPLLEPVTPRYQTIAISWGQIFEMLKQHATNVPGDAQLREVQVKQGKGQTVFHIFRLHFRTNRKETLQFNKEGKPKDLYIKPARQDGEVTGELKFVGERPN